MIGLPYRSFVLRAALSLAVFAGGGTLLAVARGQTLPDVMIVGGLGILMVGLVVPWRHEPDQDHGARGDATVPGVNVVARCPVRTWPPIDPRSPRP